MTRSHTTWKPGVSGNPRGRPRTGKALSELLRARVVQDGQAVVDVLVGAALAGSLTAVGMVLDRLEGKPW